MAFEKTCASKVKREDKDKKQHIRKRIESDQLSHMLLNDVD